MDKTITKMVIAAGCNLVGVVMFGIGLSQKCPFNIILAIGGTLVMIGSMVAMLVLASFHE
ncbi:hypothetical protein EOM81_01735 [bacterium]|nr:hypothetical protein [bacterium]